MQPGYSEANGACEKIVVPEDAYPVLPYGLGWECKRGYRAEGEACIKIKVPRHGYLTWFGDE